MTVFETPGPVALQITLGAGEVTVVTGDDGRVEVELVPLRDNDVTRQAIAEARVELTDNGGRHDVLVKLNRNSRLLGRGAKVGVKVHCPPGSELTFRSDSADLDVTGTLGDVDLKTASGDASLESVSSLRADTASGDLRVRAAAGPVTTRTASGDVSLGRCGGLVSANLVSGDLAVEEASAGLTVNTVSGDISVRSAGGGAIQVQSVSGDVHLAIKPGERMYVDARSVSGSMNSELGIEDAPPADSTIPVNDLRVRTISGDLRLTRSVVVGA